MGERLLVIAVLYTLLRLVRRQIWDDYMDARDADEREMLRDLYNSLDPAIDKAAKYLAITVDMCAAEDAEESGS